MFGKSRARRGARKHVEKRSDEAILSVRPSFWDGPKDQTSDAQLRIGESRDAGFDAAHRPGMTDASFAGARNDGRSTPDQAPRR
jgi:hypothetical protein